MPPCLILKYFQRAGFDDFQAVNRLAGRPNTPQSSRIFCEKKRYLAFSAHKAKRQFAFEAPGRSQRCTTQTFAKGHGISIFGELVQIKGHFFSFLVNLYLILKKTNLFVSHTISPSKVSTPI